MISRLSLILAITMIVVTPGCSSFLESARKSISGEDSKRKIKKESKWVSKAQYDDLLAKYKNLNDKYGNLKDEKGGMNQAYSQATELAAGDTSAETIDVFGKDGITQKQKSNKISVRDSEAPKDYDKDLDYYYKAIALKMNGKADEALKVFQFLESSPNKQIMVRAKKQVADIYFSKKQYDLALQVYEGIIRNNSFSGVVIKALEYAAKCSSQLGLKDKKLKYESILRDFFEVRV